MGAVSSQSGYKDLRYPRAGKTRFRAGYHRHTATSRIRLASACANRRLARRSAIGAHACMSESDPSVWTGRVLQARCDERRRLVLRFCIRHLNGAVLLLAIMDIRAHPISFSKSPEGPVGSPDHGCDGETVSPLLNPARRPRQLLISCCVHYDAQFVVAPLRQDRPSDPRQLIGERQSPEHFALWEATSRAYLTVRWPRVRAASLCMCWGWRLLLHWLDSYTNARFSCISDFEPALNFRRCSLFTSATSARRGRLVLHPRYRCLAARQSSGPSLDTRVRIGIARQPAGKLVAVIPTQRKGGSARAGAGARRLSILIFMPTAVRLGSRSAHISS